MDSDDDLVEPEPIKTVKKVKFHESLANDVTHDRKSSNKIAAKRPRGDFDAYLQEREAERRYIFRECFRLVEQRGDGPKITLQIPAWNWSENASSFV